MIKPADYDLSKPVPWTCGTIGAVKPRPTAGSCRLHRDNTAVRCCTCSHAVGLSFTVQKMRRDLLGNRFVGTTSSRRRHAIVGVASLATAACFCRCALCKIFAPSREATVERAASGDDGGNGGVESARHSVR